MKKVLDVTQNLQNINVYKYYDKKDVFYAWGFEPSHGHIFIDKDNVIPFVDPNTGKEDFHPTYYSCCQFPASFNPIDFPYESILIE